MIDYDLYLELPYTGGKPECSFDCEKYTKESRKKCMIKYKGFFKMPKEKQYELQCRECPEN